MAQETEELMSKLASYEEKIKDYEERKNKFLEWVEHGEPNPVFKRLYKRKFDEIFNDVTRKV